MQTRFAAVVILVASVLAQPSLAWAGQGARSHRQFAMSFLPEPAADGGAVEAARPMISDVSFVVEATAPRAVAVDAVIKSGREATAQPFEYSDGYRTRARIHKLASLATLPLFAAEGFIGQSLYNNPTSGKKSAHLAVAGAIGGLFGVNTVTGVMNLIEARKDPVGRGRRLAHGILMIAADGGFFATAALGGESDERGSRNSTDPRSLHRAMAFTSIGLATAGYLIMLFGGR